MLHYHASARDDSPFWRDVRALAVPDGLAYKLDMFRETGRIFRENNEVFTETSRLAVLVGKGVRPKGYHPAADTLPDAETLGRLADIRGVIDQTANALPLQDDYLRRIGCDLIPVRRTA